MVSAVFHSPSEVDDALPATSPSPAQTAPAPPLKAAPVPARRHPNRPWTGWDGPCAPCHRWQASPC
jgi:hypothetical protein